MKGSDYGEFGSVWKAAEIKVLLWLFSEKAVEFAEATHVTCLISNSLKIATVLLFVSFKDMFTQLRTLSWKVLPCALGLCSELFTFGMSMTSCCLKRMRTTCISF